MDDFYGRDWAEHRHKLFDAIGVVIGWFSLSRFRGRGREPTKSAEG
ncbi:hypothetical protein ACCC88_14625 [Sphingomonas sp. Sphisp140]